MFDRIVSRVRNIIRTIGASGNRAPWVAPVAFLVFFLFR